MNARFYETMSGNRIHCLLCPHSCVISDGHAGKCRVRENQGGTLVALTYARAASTAMDPMEKKPLYHFMPGESVYSIGSWGCNFTCLFCQNYHISQNQVQTQELLPETAAREALQAGAAGIAYTYNEPTINAEYVIDCGREAHERGLSNILVTNGFVNPDPLNEMLEVIDAMNIDIKAFFPGFYEDLCGGSLEPVLETAKIASKRCHIEITTLLIPEHNDAPKALEEEAEWIAENLGEMTPVHLSAYFPRYKLNALPAGAALLERARDIFRMKLKYVYVGNVPCPGGNDTKCTGCGSTLIKRDGYVTEIVGLQDSGICVSCGADNNIQRSFNREAS